ncbi:GNAT family N-acetyltransferase [Alicyclobacillus tolerans]|uniref:GNAT superfamily N-acetyltransferase n=2 Tax=Alicyclobacillus tolerans TaxID=90970 RepID=A0ABT9LSP1_9BACL|nr:MULTISPECIES: GNAT family N-acetyltransferase [Alicyclobacillus]MDP9727286.1 GNAT superfamily N-acetyltransferase [Alicyclobacillus tengchongensis]SHJ55020.1 Acetyltransferase (GNAT) domain-containing protein [Alicyclobacillus montanus]
MGKDWYSMLASYFPDEEMKKRAQFEDLLAEHDAYFKKETDEYVVIYAEFRDFIFIDYLLVKPNIRSKGVGSKVLQAFKKKQKMILLEVEPENAEDADTLKRIRFYEKNGFQKAENIEYVRETADGKPLYMDIYYWSPESLDEREILNAMTRIYKEIHNFKSHKYQRRPQLDPSDVLIWKEENGSEIQKNQLS